VRSLSELLQNALVLIPIAILIFVRVFAKVLLDKKKRQKAESKAKPSRQTPASKILDRLNRFMSGSLEQTQVIHEPLEFELSEKRRLERPEPTTQAASSKTPYQAAPRVAQATGVVSAGVDAQLAGEPKVERAPPEDDAYTRPFPQTVEHLSPLKQAFVHSVILGKPRSLDS
jgi:hypothetical protein